MGKQTQMVVTVVPKVGYYDISTNQLPCFLHLAPKLNLDSKWLNSYKEIWHWEKTVEILFNLITKPATFELRPVTYTPGKDKGEIDLTKIRFLDGEITQPDYTCVQQHWELLGFTDKTNKVFVEKWLLNAADIRLSEMANVNDLLPIFLKNIN